jgi:hypothetical protein
MTAADDGGGKDAMRKALSKAASIRLEGEVVHREHGGIAVRRGTSIFEAQAADIIEVRELEKNRVAVLVKPEGQLIRSTVINSRWLGGRLGWRPVFEDCSDCTECSVCTDCTECSVCTDCTECSVCTGFVGRGGFGGQPTMADCTECSVCTDCTECSVCTDCTECSVCTGGFGGFGSPGFGRVSAFIRRSTRIRSGRTRLHD